MKIKYVLTLFLSIGLLTSCGSQTNPVSENVDNKNKQVIATPGMQKPLHPISQSHWEGDWNNPTNPHYRQRIYNPLQGDWQLTAINGKPVNLFLAYRISPNLGIQTLSNKPKPGEEPNFSGKKKKLLQHNNGTSSKLDNNQAYYGLLTNNSKNTTAKETPNNTKQPPNTITYQINDKQLKVDNGYIYNYQVSSDRTTMTLYDGTNTYSFGQYDNNGIWYWKGNWNSPLSPYYDLYQGKYNPVKGIWKKISHGTWTQINDEYYKFYDDYTIGQSQISYGTFTKSVNYEINQDGINESKYLLTTITNTHKYWLSGDTLYLEPYANGKLQSDKLITLQRVK